MLKIMLANFFRLVITKLTLKLFDSLEVTGYKTSIVLAAFVLVVEKLAELLEIKLVFI